MDKTHKYDAEDVMRLIYDYQLSRFTENEDMILAHRQSSVVGDLILHLQEKMTLPI